MNMPSTRITDDDLHAYVDHLLDPERAQAVALHLTTHPEPAKRVNAYCAQRDALQGALAWRASEPIPATLRLSALLEARLARQRASWRIAASVALALGLGGTGGWFLRGAAAPSVSSGLVELAREAVASHMVFAADARRPVELWATQRDDLARWLSNRLNRPVSPPDLSAVGFNLMGGRLVATERGPAGLFMYDNEAGKRLSIFVRPMSVGQTSKLVQADTGSVDGYEWVTKGVGYMVLGPEATGELRGIAEDVMKQVEAPT
jgi:anti-sigma factor RsiW